MVFDHAFDLEANIPPAIEFRLALAIGLLELPVELVAVEEAVDKGPQFNGRSTPKN